MNQCKKNESLFDVVSAVDYSNGRNIFVLADEKLIGVVSQGDIIRAIGQGRNPLDLFIYEIMNLNPLCIDELHALDKQEIKELMKKNKIDEMPIVDDEGRLKRVVSIYD